MGTVTEKYVKDKVKKIIKEFAKYTPVYDMHPMTFGFGESGHPDTLLLVAGVFIGVEVKRDKNNHHTRPELKPKPNEVMQKYQAKKIVAAGGQWICVHVENLNELIKLIESYSGVFLPTEFTNKVLGVKNG